MVGTKSHGYSNSGRLSEDEYSGCFLAPFPTLIYIEMLLENKAFYMEMCIVNIKTANFPVVSAQIFIQ